MRKHVPSPRPRAATAVATGLAVLALAAACSKGKDYEIDPATAGMDALGVGTDVFGLYATEDNKRGQVLDVGAMNKAGLLVLDRVEESDIEEASGSSVGEYAESFAANLGLEGQYMWFSAEIKASYSHDYYRKAGYQYATLRARHKKHALKIEPGLWTTPARIRPYLTPLARQAIDGTDPARSWSGAEVIAAFGTHVMYGVYAGGRLDYNLAIHVLDEQYKTSVTDYAKAKFDGTFASASVTYDQTNAHEETLSTYDQQVTIRSKGGSSQYANPSSDADYGLWKASLETTPVFSGVLRNGLAGIWTLAESPARQAELRAAYEAYAASQVSSFVPQMTKVVDLLVRDMGASTSLPLDPGWEPLRSITQDAAGASLNAPLYRGPAEASHVYLAIRAIDTDSPGIGDLHLSSTSPGALAMLFGPDGLAAHDAAYGAGAPGCTELAGVDLNAGTFASVTMQEGFCNVFDNSMEASGFGHTPLELHFAEETPWRQPIRCVVLGDRVAIDGNQTATARAPHVYWAPRDPDGDGSAGGQSDAEWVVRHVRWVKGADGLPANVNWGTQSYGLYNYEPDCTLGGSAYLDGWLNAPNAPDDARYLGVCVE